MEADPERSLGSRPSSLTQQPHDVSVERVPYREAWGVEHNARRYLFIGFALISPICSSTQVLQRINPSSAEYALAVLMVLFSVYAAALPFSVAIVNPYVEDWPRAAQRTLQFLEGLNLLGMLIAIGCGAALAHNHAGDPVLFGNSLPAICILGVLFIPMCMKASESRKYGTVRSLCAPKRQIYWDSHTWQGAVFWVNLCSLTISATAVGFAVTALANHPTLSSESVYSWVAFITLAAQAILFSILLLVLSCPITRTTAATTAAAPLRLYKKALWASLWIALCSAPATAIAPYWKLAIRCTELSREECRQVDGTVDVVLGLQVADLVLRLALPYCLFKCVPETAAGAGGLSLTSVIHLRSLSGGDASRTSTLHTSNREKARAVVESREQLTQNASSVAEAEPGSWDLERSRTGKGISRCSSRASGVDIVHVSSRESVDDGPVMEVYCSKKDT